MVIRTGLLALAFLLAAADANAQGLVPCEDRLDYFSCRPFDNAPCIEGTGECECNWDNTFVYPPGSGVLTGRDVCPGENEVEEQSAFCTDQAIGEEPYCTSLHCADRVTFDRCVPEPCLGLTEPTAECPCIWDAVVIFQGTDICPGTNEPESYCHTQVPGLPPFCHIQCDYPGGAACPPGACCNELCQPEQAGKNCGAFSDFCHLQRKCDGNGTCQPEVEHNCEEGNLCTDDFCVVTTPGEPYVHCEHSNNTAACDDSDACTTSDTCAAGSCLGGPAPDCDDGDPCTAESCDAITGCGHEPIAQCGVPVPSLGLPGAFVISIWLLSMGTVVLGFRRYTAREPRDKL
jgi:hypothetical protein